MAYKGGPPALIEPEDYHVYISYSPSQQLDVATPDQDQYIPTDSVVAHETAEMLKEKQLKCILRDVNFSKVKGELKNVKDSTDWSKKLVFIISKNYMGNDRFKTDTDCALKKLHAINQMASFIGILVDVSEKELPDNLANIHKLKYQDPKIWEKLYTLVTSDEQPRMDQQPVGESIAGALAWPYYYGYLNLILPNIDERIRKSGHWSNDNRNMPQKLFIIIPESCYSPPTFGKLDPRIEDEGWVTYSASRAGNPHRDYKNSIHKIKDEDDKEYYFVGEFATPILSLWEMAHGNMCGVTPEDMFHHLLLFYYTLKNILQDSPQFKDKVTLVYYRDIAESREPLSNVLLRRIKDEISEEIMQEKKKRMAVRDQDIANCATSSATSMTVGNKDPEKPTSIPSEGSSYVGLYDINLIPPYSMIHEKRGIALIINNIHFNSNGRDGVLSLDERTGAEHDEEILTKLFKDLNFEVDLHRDLTGKMMEDLLQAAARKDHSQYDCFVCCILTHGNLGVVYSSDCLRLKITQFASFFKDCPTLVDKPKAFFFQACQGGPEPGQEALVSTTLSAQVGSDSPQPGLLVADSEVSKLPKYMQHSSAHVPGARDFLMSYSTLPGHLAFRDTELGSIYVLALDRNLRKYSNMKDLDTILKLVTRDVRDKMCSVHPDMTDLQFPFHLSTMQNLLFFRD